VTDDTVSFDALKNSFVCVSGHSFISRYRLIFTDNNLIFSIFQYFEIGIMDFE
jgi:hypothetical protein